MTSSPLRARASALVTALATAALLATFGGCDGCGGDSSEGDAPGQTSVDTAQPPPPGVFNWCRSAGLRPGSWTRLWLIMPRWAA